MVNCKHCGARVEAGDDFCPECGANVKGAVEEPKKEITREAIKTTNLPQQQSHWGKTLIWTIVIILVFLYLIGRCSTTTSEPQISPAYYNPPDYIPAQDNLQQNTQLEPAVNQPSMSEEEKKAEEKAKMEKEQEMDKNTACSGVYAKIESTCWSCGIVSCGLFAKVSNTGSKPILSFKTKAYINAAEKDEGTAYTPLDVGASGYCDIFTAGTEIRMLELNPVVMANGKEVICDNIVISFGNAYGDPFSEKCVSGFSE